jgi:hypothetical protein
MDTRTGVAQLAVRRQPHVRPQDPITSTDYLVTTPQIMKHARLLGAAGIALALGSLLTLINPPLGFISLPCAVICSVGAWRGKHKVLGGIGIGLTVITTLILGAIYILFWNYRNQTF